MAKVVGDAVMPVLTDLMNEMGESGPRKVSALREAMGHVVVVFYAAKTAIFAVWETIKGLFQTIGITVGTMAEVAAALVTRDWRRALNAIGTQYTALRDVATDTFESIATEAEKNSQKAADALERALTPATGTRTQRQGGAGSTGGDDKASVQRWEAELAAQRNAYEQAKLLEGSFQQFSKQQEADFWQAKILLTAEGSKSRAEVEKKYYDAKREVRKLDFDADMESLKVRIDEEKKINTARIDMAAQAYQAMVKAHGAGSAQAIAALARLQQVTREYFDELKHLEDTRAERERAYQASRVELERANLETLYQLGQVTAEQKLVALKTLKEREYEIDLEAENIKSKNLEEGTLEYEQHLSRLAQLKQKHAVDMAQIDGQIKVESFRVWRDIGDAITSAISTSHPRGVMQGTQTISQAIRNMAQSVLLALVDMGVKWIAQQVINAAIGKAIDKASSAGKIADAAAVGAANTFSSISAIPIVGPFLAPAPQRPRTRRGWPGRVRSP
jgi:ribosomal protein S18